MDVIERVAMGAATVLASRYPRFAWTRIQDEGNVVLLVGSRHRMRARHKVAYRRLSREAA